MNLTDLKKFLENEYCIGFHVNPIKDGFVITLADSNNDHFLINTRIKNEIRLSIEVEIEKHGANLLRLLNNSDISKRDAFKQMIQESGYDIPVYLNNNKIDIDDFIENKDEWKNFCLRYTCSPYKKNEEEIKNVICLMIDLMFSLLNYSVIGFKEGNKIENDKTTKYERNRINRKICLAYKGCKCNICGFDFQKVYGPLGKDTIEVHHIIPVSKCGKDYVINPINDLIPVCSNCHTMLHKKNPPLLPEELKEIMRGIKCQDLKQEGN